MVNVTSNLIQTVAGNGASAFAGDDGPGPAASLSFPVTLALDAHGDLFIADANNNRVRLLNGTTGLISTYAGTGSTGFNGDGMHRTMTSISLPRGLALDLGGNLFVADAGNNRIRMVSATTGSVSTVAGGSSQGSAGDNGLATLA